LASFRCIPREQMVVVLEEAVEVVQRVQQVVAPALVAVMA
jgi:hypothetical protein